MRIYFIRHAIAEDRESFLEEDHLRPLSEAGRAKARKVFGIYNRLFKAPERIYTSEATRAEQTAQLLSKHFGGGAIETTPHLNPGAAYEDFKALLSTIGYPDQPIAIVGHEPDFSLILGEVIASGMLYMDIKKASLIEVEMGLDGRGALKNYLTPQNRPKGAKGSPCLMTKPC
jgi:phosphohistidine phosphatase